MPKDRPKIPSSVKREVRKRCGFGCVICGIPLYDYEHMFEYAETRSHSADELTLLCSRHHAEKTRGLLPRAAVLQANDNPVNIRNGISEPYGLHLQGDRCEIEIGGNKFFSINARLVPLLINGQEVFIFDFTDGQLLMSCQIQDKDGNPSLIVDQNELIYVIDSWDIEFTGGTLTLRNAPREFQFQVKFEPPSKINVTLLNVKYVLPYGQVHAFADPSGFHVNGPGSRTRSLRNVTVWGGYEYALALDSPAVRGAGAYL
ncbi:hypothetical protein [Streptomyces sp. NPDC000878]